MLPPKMMIASGALLAASLIAASAAQAQTIWYVNDDGNADNGCTSWPDACPELQTALSLANAGDQIWVAAGVYVPSEVDYPEYQRLATFELIGGVEIYGGFDGTESKLDQRAGLFDQTILSGDLDGDGGPAGNSYHVVTGSGTDATARLDGFTITGGSADGVGEWGEWEVEGGGMFIEDGDPIIANCIFTGNFAVLGGGIFTAGDSTPLVSNCRFIDNSAGVCGGGMCNWGSSPTVIECNFVNNREYGVYCSPGICWDGGCGGGMCNVGSSPTVTNCSFIGNIAYVGWEGDGGGAMCGGSPTITNCIFIGNTAEYGYGGALLVGAAIITNSSFSSNTAEYGGGIYCAGATVTNCILWGDDGGEIVENPGSSATVSYSDVQGGWPGIGNTDADPLFVDEDSVDLHLQPGSPCIEAADNDAMPADTSDLDNDGDTDEPVPLDLEGNPRFVDVPCIPDTGNPGTPGSPILDMGAYELVNDDCNGNGASDACDILDGSSGDCNSNAVPDDCEPDQDCNDNGVQDICDIAAGESYDCNANGVPDECEGGGGVYYVDDDAPGDPAPGDPSVSDPAEDGSPDHPYDAIQEAIDASLCGDVILVENGTYGETINFLGKAITLRSTGGPDVTTIDAGGTGTVVTCDNREGPDTVLQGFAITGGAGTEVEILPWYFRLVGGGMYNSGSSPTVINCTFNGNNAEHGGGMANLIDSNPTVTNCAFIANSAVLGSGMYNSESGPTVTSCTFGGNVASYHGGGMYNYNNSAPTVTDCTFSGNTAESNGGGMYNRDSSPTVTNCTYSGNSAYGQGGAMASILVSNPMLTNCILWGNNPNQISDLGGPLTMVRYSDVQGGWSGDGSNNIDADPLFIDPDGPDDDPSTWQDNDYHLSAGSPCIDAADSSAVPADATDLDDDGDTDEPIPLDLDGNPRFIDDPLAPDTGAGDCPIVDMGTYEFQEGNTDCCDADLDGDGAVGASDLAELLGSWGPCKGCPADLDGNGQVGPFDLALLLGSWGLCP